MFPSRCSSCLQGMSGIAGCHGIGIPSHDLALTKSPSHLVFADASSNGPFIGEDPCHDLVLKVPSHGLAADLSHGSAADLSHGSAADLSHGLAAFSPSSSGLVARSCVFKAGAPVEKKLRDALQERKVAISS
jgi:hypothetical protein